MYRVADLQTLDDVLKCVDRNSSRDHQIKHIYNELSQYKYWEGPLPDLHKLFGPVNMEVLLMRCLLFRHSGNGRANSESSDDGGVNVAGASARLYGTSSMSMSGGGGSNCSGGWRSVFAAVSGRELRLYECAPWSPEAWASPSITCPLIATRLVSSTTTTANNTKQQPQPEGAACSSIATGGQQQYGATFAVRVGTIDGVITHNLRAETRRDLAAWARAIVQGCHAAAHSLREYTVRCLWQGKPCQLVVHHEEGFALYAAGTRATNGLVAGSAATLGGHQPLWRRSFDKLRMSADDGTRLLWLDFIGDDTEIELDLESCPKPIVFVLHNFLSAKIHRLGLSA
ncbi:hypothetical protein TKK_0004744 [Trichogramma kaykai]